MDVALDIDRRLLRFKEELARTADTETIVWSFCITTDFDGVLVDDVFVGIGVALFIAHVPAEDFKKGIEKLAPELGLIVRARPISLKIAVEAFDQLNNFFGSSHFLSIFCDYHLTVSFLASFCDSCAFCGSSFK